MATASETHVIQNLVGGAWVDSRSQQALPIPNPATGELLARAPLSTADEVREAVARAAEAWPAWRDTPVIERARIMFRMRDLLEAHLEELTASVTAENGKTLGEARGEVRRGIEVVEFACGMPSLMQGAALGDVSRGIDTTMLRAPLGVVAGITPFNFPAMIPLWMAPIALAAGNCFIHKPSERTPLTSNRLAALWLEAGLPAGVLSIVHGAKEVVDALLSDPGIAAVSFVGSQPVAAYVYATAAAHGKRVQALAGAKNFVVVAPDANMAQAAEIVLSSAFGNAGERCLASSVVVTVGDAAERLTPLLVERARALRVGDGADSATEMGPVIRSEHLARVRAAIARGVEEGARLALDGREDADESPEDARDEASGYYLRPSIFTEVGPEMSLAREEIFGPVLSVMPAPTLDDAIALANRSRFGNAAVICTTSGAAARAFQMRIEAGMVGVNIGVPGPVAWFPFAGWKQSFYGDLHATGMDAVNFYTERRVVTSRW
jgi:malonate-semialdehyde dehydrogenase (acetylating)/methylmalonate-semialdehyde dehydrogenase